MKRFYFPILFAYVLFTITNNRNAMGEVPFESILIDGALPRAYQTAIADINNDGRPDIAAVGEGGNSFAAWYENPSWKRRIITSQETKNHIDFALYDLDGDGGLEMALASEFNLNDTAKGGIVSWLHRRPDIDAPWEVHPIHAEPTAHRLRWIDLDGDGRKELINAPVAGKGASGPNFDQAPVRLLAYAIPSNLKESPWEMRTLDASLRLLHGLAIADFDRDEREDILTASLEGVTVFCFFGKGKDNALQKRLVCAGKPANGGRSGSSEVALGKFRDGKPFLATIDPWHGNELAVYIPVDSKEKEAWPRQRIDDSFVGGHALACADFDGDGDDEIIAGYRGEGYAIYLYDFADGDWKRSAVSHSVAVQGFAVGDVNGDGLSDFAAAGGTTNNVMLFLNRRKP
ncbi:MAG: VCBS repeat-containing protein [Candidatus Omnitrophota bacterium]